MAKTKKKEGLGPRTAICKKEGCFHAAKLKGFCRLHFLSALAGGNTGDQKPRGRLKKVAPWEESEAISADSTLDSEVLQELDIPFRKAG